MTAVEGRILGLDLGDKRIGLAVSDPLRMTAQPAGMLARRGPRADLRALAALVQERGVVQVVIGYPLLMSGEAGTRAQGAVAFAEALRAQLPGVKVELWDERLSTVEVQRTLIAADVSRRKRRLVIDSLSAVLILQGFMDRNSAAAPTP